MSGKRSSENEDQPKVKRLRGRPPGSQTRLSAAAGAAVVESAASWALGSGYPQKEQRR